MSGRLAEIRREYPATVGFDTTIDTCTSHPKGKNYPVPIYSAGFLLNPQWLNNIYLPRVGANSHREVIPMAVLKHGDVLKRHLHRTTNIMRHYDHQGHFFLNLCDNSPRNQHTRDKWLEHRYEHLKAICEALSFTPEEIEQARGNFKWHLTTPAGTMDVAFDDTVHGSMSQ